MIECINTQSFEEGENCASTIFVENLDLFHILGYHMRLFVYDMILFGSSFKFQEISVILVAVLINFDVKKSSTASLQFLCEKIKYLKSPSKLLLGI